MLKANVLKEDIKNTIIELLSKKNIIAGKIIFFGSLVRDEMKKYSDIDIIIVSRNFRNKDIFEITKLTAGIDKELIKKFDRPFDLLYFSDKEWEKGHSLIIIAAKEYGEIVYPKKEQNITVKKKNNSYLSK